MAISGGDFASATDPFLFASDINFSSTLMEWANYRIKIIDSEGFLNGIVDKDVQDLFWQNDVNPDLSFPVAATQTNGTGPISVDNEFGPFDKDVGGGTFESFVPKSIVHADPKSAYVFLAGRANGAVVYSLFAYVAFTWYDRDPAQILFSWIGYHLDNSVLTMKDYIDQTSFSDASDYYDSKPIGLILWREIRSSIADQTKKLFEHTADFLAIRPSGATGAVKMQILVRGALTERTTPIVLDGDSVASYTVRPTDRYRIDRLDIRFGPVAMVANALSADDAADYDTSFPIEFPHLSRNMVSQKAGPATATNKIELSLPYHQSRDRVLNHVDLNYWKDDQDEIEIRFADWTHFNFEAGDVVFVIGDAYVGTEKFLVVEKRVDLDTLTATARLLQLRGNQGISPKQADAANMIFQLRPNTLGNYVDGTVTFPMRIGYSTQPRNLDRWIDESAKFAHATQINRGTGGPAGANPIPPQMVLDSVARWPAIYFGGTSAFKQGNVTASKIVGPYTSAAVPFTFYAVVRVDDLSIGVYRILWTYTSGADIVTFALHEGRPKLWDPGSASFVGDTGTGVTGWQILVFVANPGAGFVRRNGATVSSTTLPFTNKQLVPTGDFAIGCNAAGDIRLMNGAIAELALFGAAHSLATIQSIEAHLSEKYEIAI